MGEAGILEKSVSREMNMAGIGQAYQRLGGIAKTHLAGRAKVYCVFRLISHLLISGCLAMEIFISADWNVKCH